MDQDQPCSEAHPVERVAPEATSTGSPPSSTSTSPSPSHPTASSGHKLPFRVHYEEHSAALHLHKIDVEKKVADMVTSITRLT